LLLGLAKTGKKKKLKKTGKLIAELCAYEESHLEAYFMAALPLQQQILLIILAANLYGVYDDVAAHPEDLEEAKFNELVLALALLHRQEHENPGRGYVFGNGIPRPPSIPPFNRMIVDFCLSNPTRSMSSRLHKQGVSTVASIFNT
jgi:hypothetical protein